MANLTARRYTAHDHAMPHPAGLCGLDLLN
jgi:hypothetical protein